VKQSPLFPSLIGAASFGRITFGRPTSGRRNTITNGRTIDCLVDQRSARVVKPLCRQNVFRANVSSEKRRGALSYPEANVTKLFLNRKCREKIS